jgi:Ca-activated chloride channel family protein
MDTSLGRRETLLKPPCKLSGDEKAENLSGIFGEKFVQDLVYSLFNPDSFSDNDDIVDQLLDELMKWTEVQEVLDERANRENMVYREWMEEKIKRETARQNAWNQLLKDIRSGKVDTNQLSPRKLAQTFSQQVLNGLEKEGYVQSRGSMELHRGYAYSLPDFTERGEDTIAKKILEEVTQNLEVPTIEYGEEKQGYGNSPSQSLVDYDEFIHHYDLIDLYETMVQSGLRKSSEIFAQPDLKARLPETKFQTSNVILIDSSNSMYGPKFKGAIMASLALKKFLEEFFREDRLHIVAYNDEPNLISGGQILKLRPQGNTDIGCALDFARLLLRNAEGNKNVFLITDGEPTCSAVDGMTPEENAYRSAYYAGREEVNINIVLLDQKPELRAIAENMAKVNGRSIITYVGDPLRLKEFVVRNYAKAKGMNIRKLKF